MGGPPCYISQLRGPSHQNHSTEVTAIDSCAAYSMVSYTTLIPLSQGTRSYVSNRSIPYRKVTLFASSWRLWGMHPVALCYKYVCSFVQLEAVLCTDHCMTPKYSESVSKHKEACALLYIALVNVIQWSICKVQTAKTWIFLGNIETLARTRPVKNNQYARPKNSLRSAWHSPFHPRGEMGWLKWARSAPAGQGPPIVKSNKGRWQRLAGGHTNLPDRNSTGPNPGGGHSSGGMGPHTYRVLQANWDISQGYSIYYPVR